MTSPYDADRTDDAPELPLPIPTGRVRFETGPDGIETAVVEMIVPTVDGYADDAEREWIEASSHPSHWSNVGDDR
jgi:hypothetical protein